MSSVNSPGLGGVASPTRRQSWFDKNWKWFVPALVGSSLLVLALFVVGVMSLVSSIFRESYPYKIALERANASAEVADRIGKPLKVGWFMTGSINYKGPEGDAAFNIPISGPKDKGTIAVEAKKRANHWAFQTLQVDIAGENRTIPLLDPTLPQAPGTIDNST